MQITKNPYRGTGLALPDIPTPSIEAEAPLRLLQGCPAHAVTPMSAAADLAQRIGCAAVHVKDERGRMGLGSFKALGAAYVIAHEAQAAVEASSAKAGEGRASPEEYAAALQGRCYVTASAGNHGLSVAAGAQIFGARAVVYLSDTVPEDFAIRLRGKGAEVVRAGSDYEASMQAAFEAAERNHWTLLSDSSWEGYTSLPHRLMEGYLRLAAESTDQVAAPTHILLQAGVGGLAGACAAWFRHVWGDAPRIIVVEPDAAPALYDSIEAGQAMETTGPVSSMGRLDCKAPSLIALQGLAVDADDFALISESEAAAVLPILAAAGLATSPSGGAGLAAALAGPAALGIGPSARILAILSEGPDA